MRGCAFVRLVTTSRTAKTNRRTGAYPQDPLSRMYKVTRTRIRCSTVFCDFAVSVSWIDGRCKHDAGKFGKTICEGSVLKEACSVVAHLETFSWP